MERVIFGLAVFPKNIKSSAVKYNDVVIPARHKRATTFWIMEDERGMAVDMNPIAGSFDEARREVHRQVNAVFDAAVEAYILKPQRKSLSQKTIEWLERWFRRK
jgi:hypothetical protein